jgi:uncharacterized repeat protein (TIGR03803 family)
MNTLLVSGRVALLALGLSLGEGALWAGNQAPTANVGGPYTLTMGGSIVLDGTLSSDPNPGGSIASYAWDIDGNGTFTDLSGGTPTLAWSAFPFAPGVHSIALEVTDNFGLTSAAATAILNVVDDHDFALFLPFGGPQASAGVPSVLGAALVQGRDGKFYGTAGGAIFRMNTDGTGFTVLHTLISDTEGNNPKGALIQGADGRLYGTTSGGGFNNGGTIFAIATNGTGFTLLRSLSPATDGGYPMAGLIQGIDGRLYGTTELGGPQNGGSLFAIAANGTGFTTLWWFTGGNEGVYPYAGVVQGADNRLYGMASAGGSNGGGTIYAIEADGTGISVLHSFTYATDGGDPQGGLIQGTDGRLYGMADGGGANSDGTIFAIATDGTGFTVLRSLAVATDGLASAGGLIQGRDGRLYGTGDSGGIDDNGTIFAVATDGTGFTVLRYFFSATDGALPLAGLVQGADSRLYGTTSEGGANGAGAIFAIATDGTGFTVLRPLASSVFGATPLAGLIQGTDGRLYGTTSTGGTNDEGTVFAIETGGTGFTVLHSFTSETDGGDPSAGLVQGTDGRLYGANYDGGANGDGTIFAIAPDGTGFTLLHTLVQATDGGGPIGGLVQGTDGRLYGTANLGGPIGFGTIFAIAMDGTGFTVLRSLSYASDGAFPEGTLIRGTDGRLYGTSFLGGLNGGGTVFAIAVDGTGFSALYSFSFGSDGGLPAGSLLQGSDGRLYGTTEDGGSNGGGTIFATAIDGTGFAVLRSLAPATDGDNSRGGLIEGTDRRLYGATDGGGANGGGTVFAIAKDGTGFTLLRSFSGPTNGPDEASGPIQGTDGRLYGTTGGGGFDDDGTIFVLYNFMPGIADQFSVSVPSSCITGSTVSASVTALDSNGNTATSYSGIVHITSSDGASSLPANGTLTSGVGTFSITFNTVGSQTVTATDLAAQSITGTSPSITVEPTPTPTRAPTPTARPAPTSKPTPTPGITPTPSPTPTRLPTPTPRQSPNQVPSPTPGITPTPTPTRAPTPTPRPVPTERPSPTP